MKRRRSNVAGRVLAFFCVTWAVLSTIPGSAAAAVRRTGTWPDSEKVSLSVRGAPRAEAVRSLAEKAGWSLVAQDLGEEPVHVEVKDEPAAKVLDLLLVNAPFVAERDGSLVSIHADVPAVVEKRPEPDRTSATTPPASVPPATKPSGKKGEDLFVTEEMRVAPGEVVRDVFVWGGSVVIEGTVTGTVAVFGGSAKLLGTAYVREDVFAISGSLDIENGAQVDGEVAAVFASLRRGDQVDVNCSTCDEPPKDPWKNFFESFFGRLTAASLYWIVGAVLLALALGRVEVLREELIRRPFRALGIGVLSIVPLLLIVATLAITLIGIPLAVLVVLGTGFSVYLSFSVVLLTVGRLILGQRTANPYVHLALGCVAFFLVQWIPVVGGLVCFLGFLATFGVLVTTRGAGFFAKKAA